MVAQCLRDGLVENATWGVKMKFSGVGPKANIVGAAELEKFEGNHRITPNHLPLSVSRPTT
jgi:hypothetical protein